MYINVYIYIYFIYASFPNFKKFFFICLSQFFVLWFFVCVWWGVQVFCQDCNVHLHLWLSYLLFIFWKTHPELLCIIFNIECMCVIYRALSQSCSLGKQNMCYTYLATKVSPYSRLSLINIAKPLYAAWILPSGDVAQKSPLGRKPGLITYLTSCFPFS